MWLKKAGPGLRHQLCGRGVLRPQRHRHDPQLTKIKNAAPQAIIVWTIGPAGAIVAKNKAQLGINIPLFQCHGQPGLEYIKLAGKASEGDRMPATKLMAVDNCRTPTPRRR